MWKITRHVKVAQTIFGSRLSSLSWNDLGTRRVHEVHVIHSGIHFFAATISTAPPKIHLRPLAIIFHLYCGIEGEGSMFCCELVSVCLRGTFF